MALRYERDAPAMPSQAQADLGSCQRDAIALEVMLDRLIEADHEEASCLRWLAMLLAKIGGLVPGFGRLADLARLDERENAMHRELRVRVRTLRRRLSRARERVVELHRELGQASRDRDALEAIQAFPASESADAP